MKDIGRFGYRITIDDFIVIGHCMSDHGLPPGWNLIFLLKFRYFSKNAIKYGADATTRQGLEIMKCVFH